MNSAKTQVSKLAGKSLLTAAEFQKLAHMPPEVEWFNNLDNDHTERAYKKSIKDFIVFAGIDRPEKFRLVTRAHVIAWREDLNPRLKRTGKKLSTVRPAQANGAFRAVQLSL